MTDSSFLVRLKMNYIHCICRKPTPAEAYPTSIDEQKKIIRNYLIENMGLEVEKRKGEYRLKNNEKFELSWKTDFRGSANSKFGEGIVGVKLFTQYATDEDERVLRFEKGDILITSKYSVLFGDHPSHILEIIGNIIGYYNGRFITCDFGEITHKNKTGEILFSILNTMSNIRLEKARDMNLKSKRVAKKENKFMGGIKTPFGKDWKSYSDGKLLKLTTKDRKTLDQGKPKFGSYINANGELVPNKIEQNSIKEMRKLRRKGLSYAKISKQIEEHFGTNRQTGEPNIKMSHTGVYRILNPNRKATKRNESDNKTL
jgi:hypothetical protein